jgi:hypothetical protein
MNDTAAEPTVEEVMRDRAASQWLKSALRTALERDPVDALNDAFVLAAVLEDRLRVELKLPEDPQRSERL